MKQIFRVEKGKFLMKTKTKYLCSFFLIIIFFSSVLFGMNIKNHKIITQNRSEVEKIVNSFYALIASEKKTYNIQNLFLDDKVNISFVDNNIISNYENEVGVGNCSAEGDFYLKYNEFKTYTGQFMKYKITSIQFHSAILDYPIDNIIYVTVETEYQNKTSVDCFSIENNSMKIYEIRINYERN